MLNQRSDKVELLRIAEAVATEKSIDKEVILKSMELAIQKAAKTRFGFETRPEVLHAESNALMKLAKSTNSSENCTIYLTLSPCFECSKLLVQAGVKRVVYNEQYRDTSGLEFLKVNGIEVEQLKMYEINES